MVKNPELLRRFEREMIRRSKLTPEEVWELYDHMLAWAEEIGVFPPKDPLEGIEVDIKIARVLNAVKRTPLEDSEDDGDA